MLKELIDGNTSFRLVNSITKMLENEKVSDEYFLVTKYYSVRQRPEITRKKYIYLAYDSESMVASHTGFAELEYFSKIWHPDLIVVFGKEAQKFYKKYGYDTHLLYLGYDDLTYKETPHTNEFDVGFIGTADKERWSDFYMRYIVLETLSSMKKFNIAIGNTDYDKLNEIYSKMLTVYNDMIRLSPNMRLFEAPSYGAFLLNNEIMREFIDDYKYPLKENKHYFIYHDIYQLTNQIWWAMNNKDEANARANEAKELILKQPLSAEVRAFVDKCGLR